MRNEYGRGSGGLMTGELSFMKSTPQVVGLPLEIMDKVGTTLTEKYYRNRQGASQLKAEALALPDVNNENNRKLIEGISKEVSDAFSQFAKEDSWMDADGAVMDMRDKLIANPDIKMLTKHAALAAQTDKAIEDSKATEMDKADWRARNASMYKGIKGADGKYLGYNGRGLSGDLDITKYYKKYMDMTANWKADSKSMSMNPTTFKMESASPETQAIYQRFGTIDVEKVDKQEVEDFLMSMVKQDNHLQAELSDISDLKLFRQGKLTADKDAVQQEVINSLNTNPLAKFSMIVSSPEFQQETKGMTAQAQQKYYQKIISDPIKSSSYLTTGTNDYMRRLENTSHSNPNIFDTEYKKFTQESFNTGISNIADKASYEKTHMQQQIMAAPGTEQMIKESLKNLQTNALIRTAGEYPLGSVDGYMTAKKDAESSLFTLRAQISSGSFTGDILKQKESQVSDLESVIKANDYHLNEMRQKSGVTDKDVLVQRKDRIISNIESGAISNGVMGYATRAFVKDIGYKQSNQIYDAFLQKPDMTVSELSTVMKRLGVRYGDATQVYNAIHSEIDDAVKTSLKDKGLDQETMPVFAIGSFGANKFQYEEGTNYVAGRFMLGQGDFIVHSAPKGKEDIKGQTNKDLTFESAWWQGKNQTLKEHGVTFEPALVRDDNGNNAGKQLFVATDKVTKETYLVEYMGTDVLMPDVRSEVFQRSVTNTYNPKSYNKEASRDAAFSLAGIAGGGIQVKSVEGSSLKNTSLALALNHLQLKPNRPDRYEDVTVDVGGIDFRIETVKNNDNTVTQKIVNVATGVQQLADITSHSPNGITTYIGALQYMKTANTAKTMSDIQSLFKLTTPINPSTNAGQ